MAMKPTLMDELAAHPLIDLLAAAATTAGYFTISLLWLPSISVLAIADAQQRLAVYAAGAGIMSLIAGFSGTAIAQYGSSSGPVVEALRIHHGRVIRKNWLSIVRWLLVSAIMCLVAMAIDTKTSPRYSDYIFTLALMLAVCKFVRLGFLFRLIMTAVDAQVSKQVPHRSAYRIQADRPGNPDVVDHG
jgi:hypothetical protein